jgi:hypothetical protein
MTQDLLVFFIIGSAVIYIGFSFFKNLKTKKISSGCGGCTGCELSKHDNVCNH